MKIKTLLAASLLVPGLALADAGTTMQPRPMRQVPSYTKQYYVKVEGGISMPAKAKLSGAGITEKAKFKNSYTFGFGGGYEFNEFARTDLLINYREFKLKTLGKANLWSGMLNVYLDAHNNTIFTPFALAGIGLGRLDSKPSATGFAAITKPSATADTVKGKKATNFIWNVGLGVAAKVDDSLFVDLTYRYIRPGNLKLLANNQAVKSKPQVNEFVLGFGYRF